MMQQEVHPCVTLSPAQPIISTEYQLLLNELNDAVSTNEPDDVLQFCANFFLAKLQNERSAERNSRNNTCDMDPLSSTYTDEEQDTLSEMPMITSNFGGKRRASVSAESIQPSGYSDYRKKVYPKSQVQRQHLLNAICNNFLFKNLDEEQYTDVVDAMEEKRVKKGDVVIQQGAEGDYFYVVERGELDCFINGTNVTSYNAGGSFGELALMYNAPRAATIQVTSDAVLWALDRVTFRRILMENTARKRHMYEQFLSEVPILKSLQLSERHKIADALEPVRFDNDQVVIRQGDMGDNFYMIEDGEAVVFKSGTESMAQEVNRLGKGAYFGELSLLHSAPRAATVVACGPLKCVTLDKNAFDRLLGPVMDILKRNSSNYQAILKQAQDNNA